jgi:hypothetical protein
MVKLIFAQEEENSQVSRHHGRKVSGAGRSGDASGGPPGRKQKESHKAEAQADSRQVAGRF